MYDDDQIAVGVVFSAVRYAFLLCRFHLDDWLEWSNKGETRLVQHSKSGPINQMANSGEKER